MKFLVPLVAQRRQELGQSLNEASGQLGIGVVALQLWEKGVRPPHLQLVPRIIAYLGYDPFAAPQTLSERLRLARLRMGLSRVAVARRIGISINAYERWEDGEIELARVSVRRRLEVFLCKGLMAGDV